MSFLALAKARCSIRAYQQKAVETEKIERLMEAARIAPTAVNYQPQKILILQDEGALNTLKRAANCHDAPLVCIVCADKNIAWVRSFDKKSMIDVDGTIVADHIVMEAESLGLGTCWVTYFNPDLVKKDFNFPSSVEPIAIICIGYPACEKTSPERHTTARKPLHEMVYYNTF